MSTSNSRYSNTRVSMPNCIVTVTHGEAVVEITYFSDSVATLFAGAIIGDYEQVDSDPILVTSVLTQKDGESSPDGQAHSEARGIEAEQVFNHDTSETKTELFRNKEIKIGQQLKDRQGDELLNMLKRYSNVFALSSKDIGITDRIKHVINTGDHTPICSVPRRPSHEKRALTNKLVQELLNLNIVQPSSSPWASPVVIVKKKTGDLRFCVD